MSLLATIVKETYGLFVDDGSLALAILAWVAVIAGLMQMPVLSAGVTAGLLFAGLVAILIENVLRRARPRS